jgi:hypothetical protein
MEDFKIDFQTAVILGTYLLSVAGLYWKIRLDVASLQIQISNIEKDRLEKWKNHEDVQCEKWKAYDEAKDKQDACLDEIMRGINSLKGDVKEISTNIDWLKKIK